MRLRRRRRPNGTLYPINAHDNARRHEAWHAHAYEEESITIKQDSTRVGWEWWHLWVTVGVLGASILTFLWYIIR